MKRDWLFRPDCPLCGGDYKAGEDECRGKYGVPETYVEFRNIGGGLCWWCVDRAARWHDLRRIRRARRLGGFEEAFRASLMGAQKLTAADVAEFTAHVIQSKPKWFGNPNAYHPRRKKICPPKNAWELNYEI